MSQSIKGCSGSGMKWLMLRFMDMMCWDMLDPVSLGIPLTISIYLPYAQVLWSRGEQRKLFFSQKSKTNKNKTKTKTESQKKTLDRKNHRKKTKKERGKHIKQKQHQKLHVPQFVCFFCRCWVCFLFFLVYVLFFSCFCFFLLWFCFCLFFVWNHLFSVLLAL